MNYHRLNARVLKLAALAFFLFTLVTGTSASSTLLATQLELSIAPGIDDPTHLSTSQPNSGDELLLDPLFNGAFDVQPNEILLLSGQQAVGPFRVFGLQIGGGSSDTPTVSLRIYGFDRGSDRWQVKLDCTDPSLAIVLSDPDPMARTLLAVAFARAKQFYCAVD